MQENAAKYYLILDCLVGKEVDGNYYIYRDGAWIPDTENEILDRLHGYDPCEPADSPYGYGSTCIMDEIEEISPERARDLIR